MTAYIRLMARELFSLRGISGTCTLAAMLIAIYVAVALAAGGAA